MNETENDGNGKPSNKVASEKEAPVLTVTEAGIYHLDVPNGVSVYVRTHGSDQVGVYAGEDSDSITVYDIEDNASLHILTTQILKVDDPGLSSRGYISTGKNARTRKDSA